MPKYSCFVQFVCKVLLLASLGFYFAMLPASVPLYKLPTPDGTIHASGNLRSP
jgi:hypothetical protein